VVHGGVFINYRGEDSGGYGALLYAELSRRFGPATVFLDSESITAGADFAVQLLDRVRQARAVLAVIGVRWLTAAGPDGRRRIDDPADWVRRELVEALAAGVRIIPVLTDRASMPTEADLPADLALFGRCQYRRLRHREALADIGKLVLELTALDDALHAAAAAQAPLLPAICPVPNQLPAAARHFTGRERQLAQLVEPRGDAGAPIVSIVAGMAGIGKTALAVRAAQRLTADNRYPDGCLFVDLHGCSGRTPTDPGDALEALLRGLGVPGAQIPPGAQARVGLYRTLTAHRRVLIVLDDARDDAQVRSLLPCAPTCRALVTSRRRLASLDDADHVTLDSLPLPEAIQLFRTIVGEQVHGDGQTVQGIVRLCGLLPLAIRIAAARLKADKHLDERALLRQLEAARDLELLRRPAYCSRLDVLDDGDRSVLAALEVSFQQLPAEQQLAFAKLGLHPGLEFEPYAAAALFDGTPGAAGRLLAGLENVNLLDQPAPGRYRFHDLTRAYASTRRSATQAVATAALLRLYGHYARTALAAADLAYPSQIRPPRAAPPGTGTARELADQAVALAWLDAELANLLATAHHAAAGGQHAHTTWQSAVLHRHLRVRGAYSAAEALHGAALRLAGTDGDRPAELAALTHLGWTHHIQGRSAAGADCFLRAVELAHAIGDPAAEGAALTGLGYVHHGQSRYRLATRYLARAAELARSTNNTADEVDILIGLGYVYHPQGRYDRALDCYAHAVKLAEANGNASAELDALTGLGWAHGAQGRYEPATNCLTRGLELARATGNPVGEAGALNGLGFVHMAQGRYALAIECQTRALQLARAAGYLIGELAALGVLGCIYLALGRYGPARDCYQHVLDLARSAGSSNWQFEAQLGLSRADCGTGHPDRALIHGRLALHIARTVNHRPDQARALDCLAHAYHALNRANHARRHWQQALDILFDLGVPAAEDVTAANLRARLADLEAATT